MLALVVGSLSLSLRTPPTSAPHAQLVPAASDAIGRRALVQGAGALLALNGSPLAALAINGADVKGLNQDVPRNEKEINKLLSSYGLAKLPIPGGFSPLLGYIGTAPPANIDGLKSRDRAFKSTLLVRFVFPNGWLVEVPSIDENGEAGNIGANNYGKGDSANFVAVPLPSGETLGSLKKDFFKGFLSNQMSNDVYEDVKIKKIRPVTQSDGTEMLKLDFSYTLLTRAGFTVNRKGVAAALVADNAVVGLVTATVETREKEMKEKLETMADSFRANAVKPPSFGNNSPI